MLGGRSSGARVACRTAWLRAAPAEGCACSVLSIGRYSTSTGPSYAAIEAVIALVADDLLDPSASLVITVELYVAAARRPALKAVTQAWMQRSRRALELHFDPTTAREVDALIEDTKPDSVGGSAPAAGTSSTESSEYEAGWYPDPYGQPGLRWFDGENWTHHTHAS